MALPQNIVDRLTQEPVRTPGWSGRLVLFAAGLLIVTLFVFAGLQFGYVPALEQQRTNLDTQITKLASEVPASDQANIVAFYSQLANIRSLLKEHTAVSPFFSWLERQTMGNVYFSRLALVLVSRQVLLSGVARSISDATDQLAIFQRQPQVERMTVNSISSEATSTWRFDVTLTMKSSAFAWTPSGATAQPTVSSTVPAATSTTSSITP